MRSFVVFMLLVMHIVEAANDLEPALSSSEHKGPPELKLTFQNRSSDILPPNSLSL